MLIIFNLKSDNENFKMKILIFLKLYIIIFTEISGGIPVSLCLCKVTPLRSSHLRYSLIRHTRT